MRGQRRLKNVSRLLKKVIRYAIKNNTKFDSNKLKELIRLLPEGYELKKIDADLYDKCINNPVTADFVS